MPDAWLQGRRVVSVGSVFVLPQFTGGAVGRLFARTKVHGAATVLNICWDAEGRGLPFLASALAEADNFILSYDEGHHLTGHTLPESILDTLETHTHGTVVLTLGADDAQFTRDLISYFEHNYCVDAHRIYVTGYSLGGGMA